MSFLPMTGPAGFGAAGMGLRDLGGGARANWPVGPGGVRQIPGGGLGDWAERMGPLGRPWRSNIGKFVLGTIASQKLAEHGWFDVPTPTDVPTPPHLKDPFDYGNPGDGKPKIPWVPPIVPLWTDDPTSADDPITAEPPPNYSRPSRRPVSRIDRGDISHYVTPQGEQGEIIDLIGYVNTLPSAPRNDFNIGEFVTGLPPIVWPINDPNYPAPPIPGWDPPGRVPAPKPPKRIERPVGNWPDDPDPSGPSRIQCIGCAAASAALAATVF